MTDKQKDKYYTESGWEALTNRLKTYYKIYKETPEEAYPISHRMFGFPKFEAESKEDIESKIDELQTILGVTVYEDGN